MTGRVPFHVRHALVGVCATLAGVVMYAGPVATPAMAANPSTFGIHGGPNVLKAPSVGYPAPGSIYAPFTDCPLNSPAMQTPSESAGGKQVGCVASISTSGTFAINGIPVSITHPVVVQFGETQNPDGTFTVVAPLDGKELIDSPEPTPGGLPVLLLCPGSTPGVQALCQKAMTSGQTGLTALVESAGPISNFQLTSFTQPVKIQLINPLLGGNCYIGSDSNPIVLNPAITSGTLGIENDPNGFPNTGVLAITGAQVTDSTFSVPVATGCGPGGVADSAINTLLGLPSPSGHNSLVLNGNSYLASTGSGTDVLQAAFKATSGH